jgi:hypothetical protein
MATRRLLDALGMARQAVISAQTQVKVAGPSITPAKWSRARFDALAHLITGSPYYSTPRHGRRAWRAKLEPGPISTGALRWPA